MTRTEFMKAFRDTDFLNTLTPDDRLEIFSTVMLGSSDFTAELLNDILNDYSVDDIEVVSAQSKVYSIDIDKRMAVRLKCKSKPVVTFAMDGYGNSISEDKIKVIEGMI